MSTTERISPTAVGLSERRREMIKEIVKAKSEMGFSGETISSVIREAIINLYQKYYSNQAPTQNETE